MEKIENLLLCVGAQKAGTSWLYSILRSEPDIEFSSFKEMHYFDMVAGINHQMTNRTIKMMSDAIGAAPGRLMEAIFKDIGNASRLITSVCDDEWYCRQFPGKRRYAADFTPEYALLSESDYERVRQVSNAQKIIFIMRDPVSRALSALQYFYQNLGRSVQEAPLDELLRKSRSRLVLSLSRYETTLRTLDKVALAEDVLVLFYEDIMDNKATAREQILAFLGIEAKPLQTAVLERKVNTSRKESFPDEVVESLKGDLAETVEYISQRFGRVPAAWRYPA